MNGTLDLSAVSLAVAVLALFGLFFGYVAYRFWSGIRRISDLLDGRAERQRQRLAYEEKHGTPPAWKQALRRLVLILLVVAALALVWFRLTGV